MIEAQSYSGDERRTRDRSEGIVLRRRQSEPVEVERRRVKQNGFDIAAALELHLDECKTRRSMLTLLESWLAEARNAAPAEQDEDYVRAVEHATEVMKSAPDAMSAIAMLQRQPEES